MRRGTAIAMVLLSFTAPAVARAQSQDTDAEALTRHGLELRRQRRDAEALEEFRRAYALRPTPRALAQIALAEQALGRWVDAEADLQKALADGGEPWIARNHEVLASGLAAIQARLGWLEVTANVPGAELWVNGARAGVLPMRGPIRVELGSVVLEVRAEGYTPVRRSTAVEAGGSAREAVRLVPAGEGGHAPGAGVDASAGAGASAGTGASAGARAGAGAGANAGAGGA